jgi:hypothetical protein
MSTLKSELLYRMTLEVGSLYDIGATPHGHRVIIPFKGGRFEGPKLRGEVLVTGGDWALARRDGAMELDIRRTLLTDDSHHIYVHYRGILTGSPENMAPHRPWRRRAGGRPLFPDHAGVRDRLGKI